MLAGGVGAAKFLGGLQQAVAPGEITAVVNVADDFVMHGLHISPDLDTVTYTLAGAVNPETGWGLRGETWAAMEARRMRDGCRGGSPRAIASTKFMPPATRPKTV